MQYRKLGDSNLEVSVITFGAWAVGGWMWGGTERNEAVRAIRESYDVGVTSIDTAPVYGQGLSEEIVGEAIKDIPRDRVQILTKFGMRWDLAKGDLAMHSIDNAGRDIDIYKYAGKESIIKECEDSMVKRDIEKELVPYCIENGKAIIAYSPLERGLLTGKIKPGHKFAANDHRAALYFYRDENLKRVNTFLEKITPLAEEKNASLGQIVLRWTVKQPGITIALAGARNADQALQNAAAMDIDLSNEEIDLITGYLNKLELVR